MKQFVCLLMVLFCLECLAIHAQDKDPLVEKAEKALKGNLIDNAPSVVGVDFKACRAFIKMSFSEQGRLDVSRGTKEPGGNFPKSEANVYLSSGAGSETGDMTTTEKIEVNLAELNRQNITIGAAAEKGMSVIEIEGDPGKDTIRYRRDNKYETLRRFRVSVKTKSVEKTASSFYDAIVQCEKYKPAN